MATAKAKAKNDAEAKREADRNAKLVAVSDQLAKVRAAAAKEDASAVAQGRAPPKKKAPKKPTQEKRGNPDGERKQPGAPAPPQPKPSDPPASAAPPPPPAPPAKAKSKAKARNTAAVIVPPEGPGEPGAPGGMVPDINDRGLFPLLPGGAPEVAGYTPGKVSNRMTAKEMAQLVSSKAAAPASVPNPTKPGAKQKKVPAAAPQRSLIEVMKSAAPLPKGVGGPGPKKVSGRRNRG